jgi:alkanesulfonate monooxygenase SsuD/methylene tetrahydromethanopterin reductase-like flavin-dependent oxidoreductase (luciferase family)
MQVSYFETGRYYAPSNLPRQWPMPAGAYDREAGLRAFRGMVERSRYVEELGFDWVSVSEHHYSPRILTPSLPIAAAYIASHVHNIKIALLGPIVPQSNPVLLAEEMAMLDTMAEGRLIVGMLRGTTNEMLTYNLNPEESRERTDEGMELILRAWKEPQPFGWQGRHFQYRTVSVWPKAAAAAAAADVRPRHQPRGQRFRRPQPYRPRRVVRPVRRNGQGDRLLQGQVRALRLGAGAAPDHLSRQHPDR